MTKSREHCLQNLQLVTMDAHAASGQVSPPPDDAVKSGAINMSPGTFFNFVAESQCARRLSEEVCPWCHRQSSRTKNALAVSSSAINSALHQQTTTDSFQSKVLAALAEIKVSIANLERQNRNMNARVFRPEPPIELLTNVDGH
jgi:hypothetical protein